MKLNKIFFCVAILFLASCVSREKYNRTILEKHSIEDLQYDVDAAYNKLKKFQPLLYQYISKESLDYSFDSLKKSYTHPLDSKEFAITLAPVVAKIRQGHNSVKFPNIRYSKKELKAFKKLQFNFNKLEFDNVEDTIFVRRDVSKDSVLRNMQVLKINNENVLDIIKRSEKFITSDGYNQTFQKKYVTQNIQGYMFSLKGRLDSVEVTFQQKDSIFTKKFKRYPIKKKKVDDKDSLQKQVNKDEPKKGAKKDSNQKLVKSTPKTLKDSTINFSKKEIRQQRKDSIKYYKLRNYDRGRKMYKRNFTFLGKDSVIGYLKIRSFSGYKQKKFYEETFKKIQSAKTQYLIIDLRDNYGGSLNEINNIYSYLVKDRFKFVNPSLVTRRGSVYRTLYGNLPAVPKFFYTIFTPIIYPSFYFKTSKDASGNLYYHFNSSKEQKNKSTHFDGPIYVLINGTSFSASCILSTALESRENVIYVGEETGGDYNGTVAGFFKKYDLPNTKVRISFGVTYDNSLNKRELIGRGIFPDKEIKPNYQDFINGNDVELNWILQDIQSKNLEK